MVGRNDAGQSGQPQEPLDRFGPGVEPPDPLAGDGGHSGNVVVVPSQLHPDRDDGSNALGQPRLTIPMVGWPLRQVAEIPAARAPTV